MINEKEKNRALCEKYPFLIPWNRWSGKLITEAGDGGYWVGCPEGVPEYDWEYTELDAMPEGWRKAFGIQMCDELLEALTEDGDVNRWRIVQMKEKYGALCVYDNGTKQGSRVHDIIQKYENMSMRTCIKCGRPASRITTGWISPYCDGCVPKDRKSVDISEYFEDDFYEGV